MSLVVDETKLQITRCGWLKKRGGRLHRWYSRYFILTGKHILYKLNQKGPLRGQFDLVPGCAVTEIEETRVGLGNQKLYSFWVVWPFNRDHQREKRVPQCGKYDTGTECAESEGEVEGEDREVCRDDNGEKKNLKQIVKRERMDHKQNQKLVEEQIEKHQQNDSSLSLGVKVAAVAVGGVVVGALSAGIGLVPYMTVVGLTAAAGGGAVALQYRKPADSRIILSCENLEDAMEWKKCIENEVSKLERQVKPMLPPSVDPTVISGILGMGLGPSLTGWTKIGYLEDMRVLELVYKGLNKNSIVCTSNRIRRAQVVMNHSPITVFLALMEIPSPYWPKDGSCKVLRVIDDHADELELNLHYGETRLEIILSRFWKLDDDGTYLITYNTFIDDESSNIHDDNGEKNRSKKHRAGDKGVPHINAVVTISPRRDYIDFDDDLREVLITCSLQVALYDKAKLYSVCVDNFMNEFLSQLVELKFDLFMEKLSLDRVDCIRKHIVSTTPASINLSSKRNSMSTLPMSTSRQLLRSSTNSFSSTRNHTMTELFKIKSPTRINDDASKGERIASSRSAIEISSNEERKENFSDKAFVSANVAFSSVFDDDEFMIKDLSKNAVVPSSENPISQSSRTRSSRRRNKQVNAEASILRAQIAAKEYEVQRFKKLVDKRSSQLKYMSSSSWGASSKQREDVDSLKIESEELIKLKERYSQLTGLPYDNLCHIDRRRRVRIDLERSVTNPGPDDKNSSSSIIMNRRSSEMFVSMGSQNDDVSSNLRSSDVANDVSNTLSNAYIHKYSNSNLLDLRPNHWCMKEENSTRETSRSIIMVTIFSICFTISLVLFHSYDNDIL